MQGEEEEEEEEEERKEEGHEVMLGEGRGMTVFVFVDMVVYDR